MFMDIWINGIDIYKWLLLLITSLIVHKTTTVSVQRKKTKTKQNKNETKTRKTKKDNTINGSTCITLWTLSRSNWYHFQVYERFLPDFVRTSWFVRAHIRVSWELTSRLIKLNSGFHEGTLPGYGSSLPDLMRAHFRVYGNLPPSYMSAHFRVLRRIAFHVY